LFPHLPFQHFQLLQMRHLLRLQLVHHSKQVFVHFLHLQKFLRRRRRRRSNPNKTHYAFL
jgi:hypothetical protein